MCVNELLGGVLFTASQMGYILNQVIVQGIVNDVFDQLYVQF